jgi:hypothetical protein
MNQLKITFLVGKDDGVNAFSYYYSDPIYNTEMKTLDLEPSNVSGYYHKCMSREMSYVSFFLILQVDFSISHKF